MQKILSPTRDEIVLADPTIVGPKESPDEKCHLFCHSILGIKHYICENREKWQDNGYIALNCLESEKRKIVLSKFGFGIPALLYYGWKIVANRIGKISFSNRCFIYKWDGIFYLYFQEINFPWRKARFLEPTSSIKVMTSVDLISWSPSQVALESTELIPLVACPSVIYEHGRFMMFFSSGYEPTGNDTLMEPKQICLGGSEQPDGPFKFERKIEVNDAQGKVCSQIGAFRVRAVGGKTIYCCNPIINNSESTIYFVKRDGQKFELTQELVSRGSCDKNKINCLYVADVVKTEKTFNFYFNVSRKARFLNRFQVRRGVASALILAMKNTLLRREDIYVKKFATV